MDLEVEPSSPPPASLPTSYSSSAWRNGSSGAGTSSLRPPTVRPNKEKSALSVTWGGSLSLGLSFPSYALLLTPFPLNDAPPPSSHHLPLVYRALHYIGLYRPKVVMALLLVVVGSYWLWVMCSINDDRLFKGFLFIIWTSFPLMIGFINLLGSKLDGTVDISWWLVFAPFFAFQALLLLTSPLFFIFFPDTSFLQDRVGSSFGKSIKPRYRVNIIFLSAAVLNLPVALFNAFICIHLQYNRIPWAAVFSPLFIAEIFALARTLRLENFEFSVPNLPPLTRTACPVPFSAALPHLC